MSADRIRQLNDSFRTTLSPSLGRVMCTAGVNGNGAAFVAKCLAAVAAFSDFTPDNDPHGEHDFGSFEVDDEQCFWKIDYYADRSLTYGADDPSSLSTVRVMTIMLAEEY